jgi:hypothetical protein
VSTSESDNGSGGSRTIIDNHLHVDFLPQFFGTPKCAGGSSGYSSPSDRVKAFKAVVFDEFPASWWGGDLVCRKIAGSNTWSQHAYGNAIDVMVGSVALGDRIEDWFNSEWTAEKEQDRQEKEAQVSLQSEENQGYAEEMTKLSAMNKDDALARYKELGGNSMETEAGKDDKRAEQRGKRQAALDHKDLMGY